LTRHEARHLLSKVIKDQLADMAITQSVIIGHPRLSPLSLFCFSGLSIIFNVPGNNFYWARGISRSSALTRENSVHNMKQKVLSGQPPFSFPSIVQSESPFSRFSFSGQRASLIFFHCQFLGDVI
jgi:hypothetical protein